MNQRFISTIIRVRRVFVDIIPEMNILVAPNTFKGSLSAAEAADAMCDGIRRVLPDASIRAIPVADGGDGLIETLAATLNAQRRECPVTGPLGTSIQAVFLYVPDRQLAVIEMAQASGLALLKDPSPDAMTASSVGTGQLVSAALDLGCRHIVLGIGGSATTDGGTGLATALGIRFKDRQGNTLDGTGSNLQRIHAIDTTSLDTRLHDVRLEVACDVNNPLLGELGAARIYAPQKGANPDQVRQLENGLARLADLLEQHARRDVRELAGAGAAGGMGAGLVALFGATLKPGAQLVLDLLEVEPAIKSADLVLTGEGRFDSQTRFGKAPAAVARLARRHGVACIGIAGELDDSCGCLYEEGFDALFSLCPGPASKQQAIDNAAEYLSRTTEQVVRCQQSGAGRQPES